MKILNMTRHIEMVVLLVLGIHQEDYSVNGLQYTIICKNDA